MQIYEEKPGADIITAKLFKTEIVLKKMTININKIKFKKNINVHFNRDQINHTVKQINENKLIDKINRIHSDQTRNVLKINPYTNK